MIPFLSTLGIPVECPTWCTPIKLVTCPRN